MQTQYGFRTKHSTSHALIDVLTISFDNICYAKYIALLFLDLKKPSTQLIIKYWKTKCSIME